MFSNNNISKELFLRQLKQEWDMENISKQPWVTEEFIRNNPNPNGYELDIDTIY